MAPGFRQHDPVRDGTLEVEVVDPEVVAVYFVPPEHSLLAAEREVTEAQGLRTKLLDINGREKVLTIHPINTFGDRPGFLQQKYDQVERITIEDADFIYPLFGNEVPTDSDGVIEVLDRLPQTFTKDYAFGLGLAKPYRFIIDAVEALSDCVEIVITDSQATGPAADGQRFHIAKTDFEQARVELNKIERNAQTASRVVKEAAAYNVLAERLGLPTRTPNAGRSPYRKLFTTIAQGQEELSKEDQSAVIGALTNHVADIAAAQPKKLAKLRDDIELVTLERLIQQYESMLGEKLVEGRWQAFFNENPFILNMAFGYPVIKVRDQASVGGRKLSGGGEKITDFLVKNSLTNNTALFEIKTPQTPMLNRTPFRDGVYTPSSDLSGSINQALDQKYQFQRQVAQIKDNSRLYDIESYAVHCCLVIGRTPDGEDQKKSFELFRRNSKDVEIVTFDELLEKLRQLSAFLRAGETEAAP